jgi:hypothetical protein
MPEENARAAQSPRAALYQGQHGRPLVTAATA